MSIADIKTGDRLDYPARDLHGGEVLKVGRATVWLVFSLPGRGNFPTTADARDLQPHVSPARVRVGEFEIAELGGGRIGIRSVVTGEAMETPAARLEAHLAAFWNKEF